MKKIFNAHSLSIILVLVLLGATFAYARSNGVLFGASPSLGAAAPASVHHERVNPATGVAMGSEITKNETVYVKFDPSGRVKDTTVVSWLHFSKAVPAQVLDPVQVKQVKAMNGDFKLKTSSQGVMITGLKAGQYNVYYSGHSEKALPVQVAIDYYLNGHKLTPEQLAGQSGQVKMAFHLENLLKKRVNIPYTNAAGSQATAVKELYTPLISMVSLELPADKFSRVRAEEGLVTAVGETMKVNYILFPYPSASATLSMQADNFSLEGINIVVQPQMPPLPDLNMGSKLNDLNSGLGELDKSLGQVETGSQQLAGGQSAIQNGLKTMQEGVDKLITLSQAEEKIAEGALMVNTLMLNGVKPLAQDPAASEKVKSLYLGLQKQSELLTTMVKGGKIEEHELPPMSITAAGLDQAKGGLGQLMQGSQASQAGAQRLHDGVVNIRQQGVAKIQDGVAASLNELRIGEGQKKRMEQEVTNYDSFLGKPAGADGQVQFIFQSDAIK